MGDANKEKKVMKACFFNPYLDTMGGGELYTLSFAKVLEEMGYEIFFEWENTLIKEKLKKRFWVNIDRFNFVETIKRGDNFDVCFWVSDGSVPLLYARHNFLHFQVPFLNVNGRSLINRFKFFRIEKVICNSFFTKSFIDQEYPVEGKSVVIYPPVNTGAFKKGRKENIILYVGRFSNLKQRKNQHILIDAFKKFYDLGNKDFRLVLAGGSEVGAQTYLSQLKAQGKGYPIFFEENLPFEKLVALYKKAKFFWSAVGYDVDERKEPEKVEHFGITVVEAMASGCVPVVFKAGGYKEIIKEGENGYFWEDVDGLVNTTLKLLKDKKSLNMIVERAILSSYNYSYDIFKKSVRKLFI